MSRRDLPKNMACWGSAWPAVVGVLSTKSEVARCREACPLPSSLGNPELLIETGRRPFRPRLCF